MSDFSGRDLYVGTIRGRRTWDIDSLGRLVGVTHPVVWVPGENVARHNDSPSTGPHLHFGSRLLSTAPINTPDAAPRRALANYASPMVIATGLSEHDFSECTSCGFYAYYDDEARWSTPGPISGVIEGYGTVHCGTHGFRAEKAKIVALCVETEEEEGEDSGNLGYRFGKFFYEYDGAAALAVFFFLSIFTGLLTAGIAGPLSWWAGTLLGLLVLAPAAKIIAWNVDSGRFLDPRWMTGPLRAEPERKLTDEQVQLIRRNYSDVPFYTSRDAMHHDFPADLPEPLSPETDPEFWTRRAP